MSDGTFADAVQKAAKHQTADDKRVIEAARDKYHRDGEIEIDDTTVLSEADDGAYVMAWVWINYEEAGVEGDNSTC